MFMLIYNDVDTGEQIIMDESKSYNKMAKELMRLIEEEDYCSWALHIINAFDMCPNPNTEDRVYRGFVIRQGV